MTAPPVPPRFRPPRAVWLVGYVTAASLALRLTSALLTVLVARAYGAALYGAYSIATAYASLATLFPDCGLDLLIIVEGGRARDRLPWLVRVGLLVKSWLSILAWIVVAALALVLPYNALTFALILIATAGALAANYQQTYYAAYLGEERNDRAAIATASVGALTLVGTFIPVALGRSLLVATAGGAVGGALAVVATAMSWRNRLSALAPVWTEIRPLLRQAVPFALGGLFYYIYFRIDVVMLSLWRPEQEVGWYNAAYRLVSVLYFIPGSICAALFSRLSQLAAADSRTHAVYVSQMVRYMSSIAIVLVAMIVGGAALWIATIFGRDYMDAAPLLALLGWFLLFQSISFPLGDALSTSGRQIHRLKVMGAAAILNVLLNLVAIPLWGPRGAAWATLATEAFVALGYWWIVYRGQPDQRRFSCLIPAALGTVAILGGKAAVRVFSLMLPAEALVLFAVASIAAIVSNWLLTAVSTRGPG